MPRNEKANAAMRAESRAQILAAARQLFARQGYFNCKVSDIAQAAGMSQGNVYWYFKSKEDVLRAILAGGFEALGSMAEAVAGQPGSAAAKLDALIERSLALYHDQSDFTAILLSLMGQGGAPLLHSLGFDMQQIGASYHQHLRRIFEQAQAEGLVGAAPPDVLVMFFFSFLNGMVLTYAGEWETVPPALIREALLRLLGQRGAR